MGNSSSRAKDHTCPTYDLSDNGANSFIGSMSFYHFNMIFSGSCVAFALLVIVTLLFLHATHLSKPNEQIKIMKIGLLIPFYSVLSFLSICYPRAHVYIAPWLDVVQSFALGSFFLLMGEIVSESPSERDVFLAGLAVSEKEAPDGRGDGLLWYRRCWINTFQYPVVSAVIAIATAITQVAGIYCQYESKPYFARLWLNLVKDASLVIAVLAVLRLYAALKTHLAQHKPLAKLLAFKLVVIITFLIGILFWILRDSNALKPTPNLTYADLNIGIPNMIICIVMVPLSVFFHYAYSYRPYLISRNATITGDFNPESPSPARYQGGFLGAKAWLRALNPVETLRAIVFAFTMAAGDYDTRHLLSRWVRR